MTVACMIVARTGGIPYVKREENAFHAIRETLKEKARANGQFLQI